MNNQELVCTVFSLFPYPIEEEKPGLIPSRYLIKASDTKRPEVYHVTRAMHYVYLDESRGSLQVRDAADEVASSLVNDFINAQLAVAEDAAPAIAWMAGHWTPEALIKDHPVLLEQLRRRQVKWGELLCRMADSDWNRYHRHNVVSDLQRRFAEILNYKPEDHEWMSSRTIETSNQCPSCTQLVAKSTVVCPNCRCILDQEAYSKLKFAERS